MTTDASAFEPTAGLYFVTRDCKGPREDTEIAVFNVRTGAALEPALVGQWETNPLFVVDGHLFGLDASESMVLIEGGGSKAVAGTAAVGAIPSGHGIATGAPWHQSLVWVNAISLEKREMVAFELGQTTTGSFTASRQATPFPMAVQHLSCCVSSVT